MIVCHFNVEAHIFGIWLRNCGAYIDTCAGVHSALHSDKAASTQLSSIMRLDISLCKMFY